MLHPLKNPETAKPGEWDRQAGCCPNLSSPHTAGSGTFSIGIFQWVSAKSGRCKKGTTQRRVHGANYEAPNIVAKADALVAGLNSGLRPENEQDALSLLARPSLASNRT